MKRKLLRPFLFFVSTAIFLNVVVANGQCTWRTQVTDGFEYQTACPDVIAGTVYTAVPQNWSVHSGQYSLYLNFVNCAGGTGTCAGDTVYRRIFNVCPNNDYRFSAWFTTTFAGTQSDMKIVILDANNQVLDLTSSIPAPYSPLWTQYQSATFTPVTTTITFIMITNVDGQNGNDLSMDDFLMENCYSFSLGNDTTICNSNTVLINAGNGYSSYVWNDGSTNQTLLASTTNTTGTIVNSYIVTVTDSSGCNYTDTVKVIFISCTFIDETGSSKPFDVYPNPANGYLKISTGDLLPGTYFVLSDITGRQLLKTKMDNKIQEVALSGISKGYYLYSIVNKEKRVCFNGKIMIAGTVE